MNRSARLGFKVTFGVLICRVLTIISHLRIPELCIMNGSRMNIGFFKNNFANYFICRIPFNSQDKFMFSIFFADKEVDFLKGKIVHSIK